MVLVSVLTPSFNQARWLEDNLRSVAAQSHADIEHVVMDGGSSDGSVEVLRRAGPRVRWRSEPDRGQAHALNKAFAESRGEIIGWLNSDDAYFDTEAVASAVAFFGRNPDVDVVYGHAAVVNAGGLILQMLWVPTFSNTFLQKCNFIIQPSAFVRRSVLQTHVVDEAFDFSMDRELWLRLGRRHRFARLNRVLAIDRQHPARKTVARPDLWRSDNARLADRHHAPFLWWHGIHNRAANLVFRVAGLRLLAKARQPLAFRGFCDGPLRLAIRQLTVLRGSMPVA